MAAKQLPKGGLSGADRAADRGTSANRSSIRVTANRAVLDYASRHPRASPLQHLADGTQRDRAGQSRQLDDHAEDRRGGPGRSGAAPPVRVVGRRGGRWRKDGRGGRSGVAEFERLFHDPASRDPRGYILPADQPDFLTATKFVNALLGTGVQVHRATADFEVAGQEVSGGVPTS